MNLQAWLGEKPQQIFLEQHFYRQPYSGPCASAAAVALGSWETLAAVLADPAADVMVVRRNEQREGPAPTSLAAAQALVAEGFTLLVRHAERHHGALAELAAGFARDFA